MTLEEVHDQFCIVYTNLLQYDEEKAKRYKIAIEAIKKQIPAESNTIAGQRCCAFCGKVLKPYERYCFICGQRINEVE